MRHDCRSRARAIRPAPGMTPGSGNAVDPVSVSMRCHLQMVKEIPYMQLARQPRFVGECVEDAENATTACSKLVCSAACGYRCCRFRSIRVPALQVDSLWNHSASFATADGSGSQHNMLTMILSATHVWNEGIAVGVLQSNGDRAQGLNCMISQQKALSYSPHRLFANCSCDGS